jgi:Uma2 family endonuclease
MSETRLVTAEELLAMGQGRRELILGEVVELSHPGPRHGWITARICRLLDEFVESGDLGPICTDTGFRLERDPDTVRAPDVAFIAADRLEGHDPRKFLPFAPDLAVEVVSPNDFYPAVEAKAAMWIAHGTRAVWVVEPESRRVFVYRPGEPRVDLGADDEIDGGDALPGFTAPVERFFP